VKKLLILTSVFASFVFFLSCRADIDINAYDKKELSLRDFETVHSSFSGDVIIHEGARQKVVVEGPEDRLDDLDMHVNNGALKIKFKPKINTRRGKFTVYITMPKIEEVEVNGSGNATINSIGNTTEASLKVSGSGKIEVNTLSLERLLASVSGSGEIYVNHGDVDKLDVEISGSGDCNTKSAPAKHVTARVKGSGTAILWAEETLDATISGSGTIKYYGNPRVSSRITGSGKLKPMK
jgi:hypothetical protein